jgi:hypothetical protein
MTRCSSEATSVNPPSSSTLPLPPLAFKAANEPDLDPETETEGDDAEDSSDFLLVNADAEVVVEVAVAPQEALAPEEAVADMAAALAVERAPAAAASDLLMAPPPPTDATAISCRSASGTGKLNCVDAQMQTMIGVMN